MKLLSDLWNLFFSFCQQPLPTDAELNGADIYIPVSYCISLQSDLIKSCFTMYKITFKSKETTKYSFIKVEKHEKSNDKPNRNNDG